MVRLSFSTAPLRKNPKTKKEKVQIYGISALNQPTPCHKVRNSGVGHPSTLLSAKRLTASHKNTLRKRERVQHLALDTVDTQDTEPRVRPPSRSRSKACTLQRTDIHSSFLLDHIYITSIHSVSPQVHDIASRYVRRDRHESRRCCFVVANSRRS